MTLKLVLFDLDGTLLDTIDDLASALNDTLKKNQRPPVPREVVRKVVSNGASALIKLGCDNDENSPLFQRLKQELLDDYEKNVSRQTQLFNGIYALLTKLSEREVCWGVVTNKPWKYTKPIMEAMNFPTKPSCIICPDHVNKSKPDPEGLLLACKQSHSLAAETLFIGDHLRDIESGINANIKTIAVGYGYTKEKSEYLSWPATHFAQKPDDIWPIIKLYLS